MPHILLQLELPAVVIGFFCAGTLAASMSSGDAILRSAGSVAVRDAIVPLLKKLLSDKNERLLIQILVLVIGLVSYFFFAVTSDISIVALLLAAYGGVAQIFPVTIAMFYWRRATKAGALSGLFGGIAVNTFSLLFRASSRCQCMRGCTVWPCWP